MFVRLTKKLNLTLPKVCFIDMIKLSILIFVLIQINKLYTYFFTRKSVILNDTMCFCYLFSTLEVNFSIFFYSFHAKSQNV